MLATMKGMNKMQDFPRQNHEAIPSSKAARLACFIAFIPLVGILLYIPFAFWGLIQIGRGRTGFYLLRNGLIAVMFLSVAPIAGLVWWAELPQDCYLVLRNFTKHGRIDTINNGQLIHQEYFRFGKSFKRIVYRYHKSGKLLSEETFFDKQKVKTVRWYENGQKMAETTYENGYPKGESSYFYDNGKTRLIESYIKGKRNGPTSWFDKYGKLERTMNYIDGISQEQIDAAKKAGVEPVIAVDLGNGVKMRMIFIPPGEFIMGSAEQDIAPLNIKYETEDFNNERPQHRGTIKHGFYLCETEITQAQWKAITGDNPSEFKGSDSNPVESISWNDVHDYIKKLNTQKKDSFRLPSETELEYACRAGAKTRFGFGDNYDDLDDYAWYKENSDGTTHPVGKRKPNGWGIFDLHGNVWEWIEDEFHGNYESAPNDEVEEWAKQRILRGGSWLGEPETCRSSCRSWSFPGYGNNNFGFRLALDLCIGKIVVSLEK